MKKIIVSAAVLLIVGTSAFKSAKPSFEKYISKEVFRFSSFVEDGIEGNMKVEVKLSETGITSVKVLSGINDKIDAQITKIIVETPAPYIQEILNQHVSSFVVPIQLVISK